MPSPRHHRPLQQSEVRRLLRSDRRVNTELRNAISQSLTMDALSGEVPPRLRQLIIARLWPVSLEETFSD